MYFCLELDCHYINLLSINMNNTNGSLKAASEKIEICWQYISTSCQFRQRAVLLRGGAFFLYI